jgi:hypothetical protein
MLLGLVLVVVAAGWLVLRLPPFGGRFEGARLARMQGSPQWHGGRFENTPPQDRRYHLLRSWELYRQGQQREPRFEVPVVPIDARRRRPNRGFARGGSATPPCSSRSTASAYSPTPSSPTTRRLFRSE